MHHYIEADDRNRVIYHNHSDETAEKIAAVLKDAAVLKELCGNAYDESSNYQLLLRVLREQAVQKEDGSYRLRTKEDGGMDASILQNPADPDATYREKAGKQNRGYVANVIEAAGENGSIVLDYQYEQNTHSDSQFLQEALEAEPAHDEPVTIVTDGAYAGGKNQDLAKEKQIELVTTNLTGRETEDIMGDFEYSEDGKTVTKCPGGQEPKSCSYNATTGQWALQQRMRKKEIFQKLSRFRNGVETIPSILRRKYGIDHIPVRGLIRSKFFVGNKIIALNFKKFCKAMQGMGSCAHYAANA